MTSSAVRAATGAVAVAVFAVLVLTGHPGWAVGPYLLAVVQWWRA